MNGARRARRGKDLAAIHAVLCALLILILLQFLLLGVSVEGFLSGRQTHLGASSAGSVACFFAGLWLLRYLAPPPSER